MGRSTASPYAVRVVGVWCRAEPPIAGARIRPSRPSVSGRVAGAAAASIGLCRRDGKPGERLGTGIDVLDRIRGYKGILDISYLGLCRYEFNKHQASIIGINRIYDCNDFFDISRYSAATDRRAVSVKCRTSTGFNG